MPQYGCTLFLLIQEYKINSNCNNNRVFNGFNDAPNIIGQFEFCVPTRSYQSPGILLS